MRASWLGAAAGASLLVWYLQERRHRRTHAMPGGLRPDIQLPHEADVELYHNAFSLCSKKVRMCLAELGIPYRSRHIDLIETGSYENISRAFLAVNPAALVPVLVHQGHPIYESHEIIRYAAALPQAQSRLVPEDPELVARMQEWIDRSSLIGDDPTADLAATAGNCVPGLTIPLFAAMIRHIPVHRIAEGLLFHRLKSRPLSFLGMKLLGLGGTTRLPAVRRLIGASRAQLERHLDGVEAALASGGPWLLGEQRSLADISWAVILERLREADWLEVILDQRRPALRAYWQRTTALPSYRTAMLEHQHPLVVAGHAAIRRRKNEDASFRTLYATASDADVRGSGSGTPS